MTLTAGTSSHSLWPPKQPVAQTLPFKTTKVNEPKLPSPSGYLYLYLYLSIPTTIDRSLFPHFIFSHFRHLKSPMAAIFPNPILFCSHLDLLGASSWHIWPLLPSWNAVFSTVPRHHIFQSFLPPHWTLFLSPGLSSSQPPDVEGLQGSVLHPNLTSSSPLALNTISILMTCAFIPSTLSFPLSSR